MDIGDFFRDLVSEIKGRTKNKIVSTVVVTWVFTNYSHFIDIIFADNRTPDLVNGELESAIFGWENILIIPCFFILYIYYLPKANYWLKSFLHNRFEFKVIQNDIKEQISIETEKRKLIDVRSGNRQREELQSEIERVTEKVKESYGEIDKLNEELRLSESNTENKMKKIEEMEQREMIAISWFGKEGYNNLISKGIQPIGHDLKESASVLSSLFPDQSNK